MPLEIDLTDSEGFFWDLRNTGGLNVQDGTSDAFDSGLQLFVNATPVGGNFSVDENGREINVVPQILSGIAVTRSILVSDATISPIGYARFLDSFTNTTDQPVTITVETRTDSGADFNLATPVSSPTGLVTSDGGVFNDSLVMFAYGDNQPGSLAPFTIVNGGIISVLHTLTLQPGETQSLLQFATQNDAINLPAASLELTQFTQGAVSLSTDGLLAGLDRDEMLSIVNYSGFNQLVPAHTLVDSDGNRWGIDDLGRLSTLDTGTLQNFEMPSLVTNFNETINVTSDFESGAVTVVTKNDEAFPGTTVTYDYTPLQGQGVVRLLVTIVGGPGGLTLQMDPTVTTGANPLTVVTVANSSTFVLPSGVLLDDSESGSGGTLPALTFVHGVTGVDNNSSSGATNYVNTMPGQGVGPGGTARYLFFFALNDTGLDGLTDLNRLNTPGPQELAGLSANEVAFLLNFDLDEDDRLELNIGTPSGETIQGHGWGDNIIALGGDDDISAGGSDDVVSGGDGEDQIDGGDGDDILAGDNQNDYILGGKGADLINGDAGDDNVNGQAGNDQIIGGSGIDRLYGGGNDDNISGGFDNDIIYGNTGKDTLFGEDGADELYGNTNNDTLDGGAGADRLAGGTASDVYITDGLDTLIENVNEGVADRVESTVTFTLATNFEHLTLLGTDAINGTGNSVANTIIGNSAANILTGGGGADILRGGDGADVYISDGLDTFVENIGEGTDRIEINTNHTLGANFENLTLLGTLGLSGTGNELANEIIGNTGANALSGGAGDDILRGGDGTDTLNGGLGNDFLSGNAGADNFVFDAALDALTNVDTISTVSSLDKIIVDNDIFTALGTGFTADEYRSIDTGTVFTSVDASDNIIYLKSTGELFYDRDGSGTTYARILFAELTPNTTLAFSQFLMIE